jgi:hypothetical protein
MILRRAPARMRGSSSRQAPRLRDRWCPGGRYGQPLFCARHRRAFFMACGRRGARVGATAQRALPPSTAPASMHGTAMRITIAVGSGRSCSRQARRRSGISGVCWPRLNPASWSCCAGAPPCRAMRRWCAWRCSGWWGLRGAERQLPCWLRRRG